MCVIKLVWSYNNIIPTLHIIELIIQTAADNLFINVRKEVDHSGPDQLSKHSDFTDYREQSVLLLLLLGNRTGFN